MSKKFYSKDLLTKEENIDNNLWFGPFVEYKHLEEAEAELQKLREFVTHNSSCELVSLSHSHIPAQKRKCTCGLDELNQSKDG